ncbi:MAG: sigma-54 dependent transcriptional regulator [Porticoccaceae bacterium]|nr:sigma-54 dependent transcriptional regulator [Porticoccaceae bacterium]MDG1475490.1 sigma-54 dependent transcriptional regulator [Porticoccaceae bacterium]
MSKLIAIVGSSPEMEELRGLIQAIAPSDSTTLITGESGTGKELVAQAIHDCSLRKSGPFIPINCGAIPKDLLESELFGHRKGSFTGAISDRKGRFQLADGGTLFLDEIGDMPMDLQVKLLRVLQERTIDPVGAVNSISIDVRVVAATHQNIHQLIDDGSFREDLYYRLNVIPIEIRALSDRLTDIPELFQEFAAQVADPEKKPIELNNGSMKTFLAYHWPGNVRELFNLIQRFTTLYPSQEINLQKIPVSLIPQGMRSLLTASNTDEVPSARVAPVDTPIDEQLSPADALRSLTSDKVMEPFNHIQSVIALAQGGVDFPEEGVQLKERMLEIERGLIKEALLKSQGNVSKTARLLSVQRTTLIEKINKFGLSAND